MKILTPLFSLVLATATMMMVLTALITLSFINTIDAFRSFSHHNHHDEGTIKSIPNSHLRRRSPHIQLMKEHALREKLNRPWYKESPMYKSGQLKVTPDDCEERFFTQPIDHFSAAPPPSPFPQIFQQRFFVCGLDQWQPGGPIFFYSGNESPVTLYKNLTGLMFETASEIGNTLLIFSEMRYFGKSLPFPGEPMPSKDKLYYLSVAQILADHANLANAAKYNLFGNANTSTVICFGGSFGGMLTSALRLKYPTVFAGAIAGSAPILAFEDMVPPYDVNSIAQAQTMDAHPAPIGQAKNPYCADTIRQSWIDMQRLAQTGEGRAALTSALRLCSPFSGSRPVADYMNYFAAPYGDFAMSSYSFPSSYLLLGGAGVLPAYPMGVACESITSAPQSMTPIQRVTAMANSLMIYFNATGDFTCIDIDKQVNEDTAITNYLWGGIACSTQVLPSGQSGAKGSDGDMFWMSAWNKSQYTEYCVSEYGFEPEYSWARDQYAGRDIVNQISNIVYSNGAFDIWTLGGVLPNGVPASRQDFVTAILIEDQGHHADLFFSHANDTAGLLAARQLEKSLIKKWLAQS